MKKILFVCREKAGFAGFDLRTFFLLNKIKEKTSGELDYFSFNDFFLINESENFSVRKILKSYPAQFRYLKKNSPSLLVIQRVNYHSLIPFIYALLFKVPYIVDTDDWEFKEELKKVFCISNSFSENLGRLMVKKAAYVVCASHYLYDYYKNLTEKISLIPTLIDEERFLRLSNNLNREGVVWAGSLDSGREETYHSLRLFAEAFSLRKDLKVNLTIIARGALAGEISANICQLKDERILFYENLTTEEVGLKLQDSLIGILPLFGESRFFSSKSPVKVFEYMAAGLFTIAASGLETDYILTEYSGKAVKNPEEMTDLIKQIIDKKIEIDSEKIREEYKTRYSADLIAEQWTDVLTAVL